jgi:mono/diheme cytochrome c family protein
MIFSIGLSKKLVLPAVASMVLVLSPALFGQAETGEAIYKRNCAGCHGADGSGQTAMGRTFKIGDLRAAEAQKMTDAQLADLIAKGKGKMPAYEKRLSHEQIQSVVGYLRELAKKK